MNKWKIKYMVDPGDGLVSEAEFEHESNDICDVVKDAADGDIENEDGEGMHFGNLIVALELQPPE